MKKVNAATIRWSQDSQIKLPVTLLDKVDEVRITLGSRNVLRAKFDEDGVLVKRGGAGGDDWTPVLTNESTWIRRVREAGGLVEVFEADPEVE